MTNDVVAAAMVFFLYECSTRSMYPTVWVAQILMKQVKYILGADSGRKHRGFEAILNISHSMQKSYLNGFNIRKRNVADIAFKHSWTSYS